MTNTLLPSDSQSNRAYQVPDSFVVGSTDEFPAAPAQEQMPIRELTPADLAEERIRIQRQLVAATFENIGVETPIYDQLVHETLPDNLDAIEILEVIELIETHRENRMNEIVEINTMSPLKPRAFEMKMRVFKADLNPLLQTRAQVEKDFIELEAKMGGNEIEENLGVSGRELVFTRNERKPDEVECYIVQHSTDPEKDLTIRYTVSPKEGVRKYISYVHRPLESHKEEVAITDADVQWLKIATEVYRRSIVSHFEKHFDKPAGGRHRQ